MKGIVLGSIIVFSFLVFSVHLEVRQVFAQEKAEQRPLELDGTEWDIAWTFVSKKGKEETGVDRLIFKEKKFSSENFTKEDYNPTHYTLSVKGGGTTVFETMQTKDEETVFWQGRVQDQTMRGIISIHPAKGNAEDRTFTAWLVTGELKERQELKVTPQEVHLPPKEEVKEPIQEVQAQVKGEVQKLAK